MLGLLASPSRLPAVILPALAIGCVLILLARPAAVLVSALPLRAPGRRAPDWLCGIPWRWQAFLSWAGLRGAVPIVPATIPMSAQVPGATRVFDVVFVVVVVCTLLQAPTLPLETLAADMQQAQIPAGSRLHGVEVFELRLPAQANVALIVRNGRGLVPQPATTLRAGDWLLVVAAPAVREQTERRLRTVSRAGKLAGWLGERGL